MTFHSPMGRRLCLLWTTLVIASVSVILGYVSGRTLYGVTALGTDLSVLWWYAFSFASGSVLIVSPAVLPSAHIMESKTLHRSGRRSFALTCLYIIGWGVVYATLLLIVLGAETFLRNLSQIFFPGLMNWVLILVGLIGYLVALGESGYISLQLPRYRGVIPEHIHSTNPFSQAFHLGVYAAIITIGGVPSALILLFGAALLSGGITFGLSLFATHIIGLFFAFCTLIYLASYRIRTTVWLAKQRQNISYGLSWTTFIVAAYLATQGLFSLADQGIQPLTKSDASGFIVLALLVLIPLWVGVLRLRSRLAFSPLREIARVQEKAEAIEEERRRIEDLLDISHSLSGHLASTLHALDVIEKERRIYEDTARWQLDGDPRSSFHSRALFDSYHRRFFAAIVVTLIFALLYFVQNV